MRLACEKQASGLRKGFAKPGDVLLTHKATIGRTAIVSDEYDTIVLTPQVTYYRVITGINNQYLKYYFDTNQFQQLFANWAGSGSTRAYLGITAQRKLPIILPPIEIQNKIVNILSALDNKITLNNKINANLQQQAQAIFKSWFVDFEPFGGTRPEDWSLVCLEDCCSLIARGIAPKYDDTTDQIVLNQKCIRNQQIDLSKARKHRPKKVNEKWLQHGDILINSTGQGTLGRIAQVHFQPQNMTVDSHVTIVRPKHELLVYYLGCLLTGRECEFVEMERGSTGQTELPRESVQKYEVLLPDNAILKRFNDLVRPIFQLLVQNQEESLRLAEVRDALLPKLMSGELNLFNI